MRQLDVLFVEPNASTEAYQDLSKVYSAIETPTWSLLLSQSCRSKGYGVAILDCTAERLADDVAIKKIKEYNPRLVVFVMYGQNPNSGTTTMIGANKLAAELKLTYPEYPICYVGSHVSALPKEVLAYQWVDFVLLNEGVYALHNLLKTDLDVYGGQVDKVKGIGYSAIYEGGRSIKLNPPEHVVPQDRMDIDLPGYAWDLLPYNKKPLDLYRSHFWHAEFNHNKRTPFAALYTSLGCNFGCQFCMINILNRVNNDDNISSSDSRGMRFWSPEFILKEFEKLSNLGVETVRISDEMFFLNRKYFEPLVQGIIDRNLKFNMWAYSRVDTVQKKYLESFKKAGINWLALGIEAANQEVRQEITKGTFKNINIRDVVKTVRDSDINVISNYIFGLPNDTQETMQQTLDLALELNTETANMYPCVALPGSPLHLEARKSGLLPNSLDGYAFFSYNSQPSPTKFLSSAEVLKFRDNAWQTYFTNPKYLELVENRFGKQQKDNLVEMSKIKLKRRLLGD